MKTDQAIYKPLRHEYRLEYCCNHCDDTPVSHERKLYPGYWIVRCTECLYMRRIETVLGLDGDMEHIECWSRRKAPRKIYPRKGQVGAAALVDKLFVIMAERGLKPVAGDVFTNKWLSETLDLTNGPGMAPYAIIKRMLARGYVEATDERTVYRWVEF